MSVLTHAHAHTRAYSDLVSLTPSPNPYLKLFQYEECIHKLSEARHIPCLRSGIELLCCCNYPSLPLALFAYTNLVTKLAPSRTRYTSLRWNVD
jgi:hypothetical protein